MTIVRMHHCRELKYCAAGVREFFRRHGLDWGRFLREGLPADEIAATGDAIAHAVIAQAERSA